MKLRNQIGRGNIAHSFIPGAGSPSFEKPKNEMNLASGSSQFATQETVFDPANGGSQFDNEK